MQQTMLDHLLKVAPLINKFTLNDFGVAICNKENWLKYIPAERLDLKVKAGEPVEKETACFKAMQSNKRVVVEVPKEVYGIKYIAVGLPIYDNTNNIIGAVAISESLDRKEEFEKISQKLVQAVNPIATTIEMIASEAQELSSTSEELTSATQMAVEQVKDTDNIINTVKNIAKETNLIGLNAAIEAARVGEHGKGFAVVAEEVRKLSNGTAKSTKEIEEIISKIKEIMNQINLATDQVGQVAQGQAQKLSDLNPTVKFLKDLSDELLNAAEALIKDESSFSR